MDNIKVLEEIGLKRVSVETHIEERYLKLMVDCDFDKLDHVNTHGFIKILSREYKLDLDAWSEAFEDYWKENRKKNESEGLFIVVDDKPKSKKLFWFILIVLIGIVLSVLFSMFEDKIDLSNYQNSEETSYEQTAVIQEAQESLDEVNSSFEASIVVEDEVLAEIDSNETIQEIVTIEEEISEEINEEKEEIVETIAAEKKTAIKEPTEKISPRFNKEAIIVPNSQLWVGVIYLDSKKRRSYLGEGNFSIDISREQIITTGHGSFNIQLENEKKEFNKQAPIRFLVKDLNITQISASRFRELNEGKAW